MIGSSNSLFMRQHLPAGEPADIVRAGIRNHKANQNIAKLVSNIEHTTEQVCKRLDQLEAKWGERFGQVFKTITVDNGSEFADWEGMQQSAADESEKRVTVFYCHPYCSFERGSNENQNRLVRRKIPKGENFDDRTEDDIQRVEDWINDYPREMFGWKTSGELFQEELARLA